MWKKITKIILATGLTWFATAGCVPPRVPPPPYHPNNLYNYNRNYESRNIYGYGSRPGPPIYPQGYYSPSIRLPQSSPRIYGRVQPYNSPAYRQGTYRPGSTIKNYNTPPQHMPSYRRPPTRNYNSPSRNYGSRGK